MERKMRVGLAGLGAGAVNALVANPGLSNHPKVALTAGADLRDEARDEFAKRYNARTYASVEAMCASGEIDAIYILTPNGLHADTCNPKQANLLRCTAGIFVADT